MSRPRKNYHLWLNKQTGYYYWRLPGGTWRTTGCKTPGKAELYAQEQYKAGNIMAAAPRAPGTVYGHVEPYFDWNRDPRIIRRRAAGKQIAEEHAKNQRRISERFILADKQLMNMLLLRVKPNDLEAWRNRVKALTTPRVLNSAVVAIKTIFADLLKRGLIIRDPSAILLREAYSPDAPGAFSRDELRALFHDHPEVWGQYRNLFFFGACTGCRRGEILAARWKHFELDFQLFHLSEAFKDTKKIGEPKWNSVRTIPLADVLAKALRGMGPGDPEAFIFHNPDGSRIGATAFNDAWRVGIEAAVKANLLHIGNRRLVPHSCRHTLTTLAREKGIPDVYIRAVMGWSRKETMDGYSHITGRPVADLVDEILGDSKKADG